MIQDKLENRMLSRKNHPHLLIGQVMNEVLSILRCAARHSLKQQYNTIR